MHANQALLHEVEVNANRLLEEKDAHHTMRTEVHAAETASRLWHVEEQATREQQSRDAAILHAETKLMHEVRAQWSQLEAATHLLADFS